MFGAPPITVTIKKLDKGNFFQDKTGKKTFAGRVARELGQLGAFIRQTAIRSIRRVGKRGAASKPGRPPKQRSLTDEVSLRWIFFQYVPFRNSVVIGPLALNMQKWYAPPNAAPAGATPTNIGADFGPGMVPRVLEHGGYIGVHEEQLSDGKWVPVGRKRWASNVERLIPVWKATPAEKAAAKGIHTVMKAGKAVNYYRIPGAVKRRVRMVRIDPRPFMEPAARKEMEKVQRRRDAVKLTAKPAA